MNSAVAHLVTDEAMAAGRRFGRFTAVCGDSVLAASLTAPESGYCRKCRASRAERYGLLGAGPLRATDLGGGRG